MLGNAHLFDAALVGNFAVSKDVLNGHRTVAVGYDMQMIVDQSLLQFRERSTHLSYKIPGRFILPGHPLTLVFITLEPGAFEAAVLATGFIALDDKSDWLEGSMPCGLYTSTLSSDRLSSLRRRLTHSHTLSTRIPYMSGIGGASSGGTIRPPGNRRIPKNCRSPFE